MLSSRGSFTRESALNDGNCTFNSSVLGLAYPNVLDAGKDIPDNHSFVIKAAAALNVTPVTWAALKEHMLSPSTNRTALQVALAPLFRDIAFTTLLNDPVERALHLEATNNAIQAELENYFRERSLFPDKPIRHTKVGDIFIRHFEKQFETFYQDSQKDIDVARGELIKWWAAEGHTNFLNAMARPAVNVTDTHLYAGDLELAPIGNFFGVNIVVISQQRGLNVQLNRANGKLLHDFKDKEITTALVSRGVIHQDATWTDISSTAEGLDELLSAVPDYDLVYEYIVKNTPKSGDPVPADIFSFECLQQLYLRGVVNNNFTRFMVTPNDALLVGRLSELVPAVKNRVVDEWKKTYRPAPVMTLENKDATHWDTLQPPLKPRVVLDNVVNPIMPSISIAPPPKQRVIPAPAISPVVMDVNPVIQPAVSQSQPIKQNAVVPSYYQPLKGEREVNKALDQAYDTLLTERSSLSEDQVQEKFEDLFEQFAGSLRAFTEKRIDFNFFKANNERILKDFTQDQNLNQTITPKKARL